MTMNKTESSAENYQELRARLDDVLGQLQAGDLDLDAALQLYEEGQVTIKKLEVCLEETAHTFEKLKSDKS